MRRDDDMSGRDDQRYVTREDAAAARAWSERKVRANRFKTEAFARIENAQRERERLNKQAQLARGAKK